MNELDIIEAIRKGDEAALGHLYQKHFRMMEKLVLSNSGSHQDAKDIYQEALVVFWQKVISNELVLTSKISTYLYSICQNLWRKELHRRSRLSHEEKDGTEWMQNDRKEIHKIIHECIGELGDTCKQLLSYYYFDGMSMQEIADKMGFANTNTTKTKKYKCKQRLDDLVKEKYKEEDFLD